MKLSEILEDYIKQKKVIDELNNKIKEKKVKLSETKNTILQYMNKKNIKDLKYDDNKFILKNNKTYSSFTQKYLKDSINTYFNNTNNTNKTDVDGLIKFILSNRQEIIQPDLQFIFK